MNHREILHHYGIRAQKSLGQNFLVHDGILETIADSIEITGKDILEIGPGYGALTEKILARKPKSLTLIELDKKMVSILESRIHEGDLTIPNETELTIVEGDVLKYVPLREAREQRVETRDYWTKRFDKLQSCEENSQELASRLSPLASYSIIANIPYYITSPILFRFLHELDHKPNEMTILMQKEVGDKILRKKWYNHSYLSLALEFACETIEEICLVPKENFIPAPKVDSTVLFFKRKQEYNGFEAKRFLKITGAGFSAPRKKLLSNLANALHIPKETLHGSFERLGILETARAEELDIKQWKELIREITNLGTIPVANEQMGW